MQCTTLATISSCMNKPVQFVLTWISVAMGSSTLDIPAVALPVTSTGPVYPKGSTCTHACMSHQWKLQTCTILWGTYWLTLALLCSWAVVVTSSRSGLVLLDVATSSRSVASTGLVLLYVVTSTGLVLLDAPTCCASVASVVVSVASTCRVWLEAPICSINRKTHNALI